MPGRSGSVLRISDEKTLQLVELYAEEDCLWNPLATGYKNRQIRQRATERIATILDLPNFTAKHVVAKVKNLRNSYIQELKKIAASKALDDHEVYRPRVLWFKTMDSFLRPFLQSVVREGAFVSKDKESERSSWSADSEDEESAPAPPAKRSRGGSFVRESLRDLHDQLHALLASQRDHSATFGQHVASLLRRLPAERALALQPRLLLLITEELAAAGALSPKPERPVSVTLQDIDRAVKIEMEESD